jgi:hypothetical protein
VSCQPLQPSWKSKPASDRPQAVQSNLILALILTTVSRQRRDFASLRMIAMQGFADRVSTLRPSQSQVIICI